MDHKKYLKENVLDFWLKNAIDEEYGGIFTCLDRQGAVYGTEKSVWFQGRALWTFSKVYNLTEKRQEYLEAADKIYPFLSKCEDKDGRMFFTVTKDGRAIQKRRYYFSETFAAIGCAEYYKATGNEDAWENAEKYFETAWKCFTHPEMNPPKYNITMKALSPAMIMLSTARVLASCKKNRKYYNNIAKKLTNEVLHGGYISGEQNALLENVMPDGSFCNTPMGRTVNPGHSLETAWFLMGEGIAAKNDEALDAAKRIIDFTMPLGFDKKHGGIIAFTDVKGMPPASLEWDMKLWWPQNEAIIANRLAYAIFGDNKYLENYEILHEYAFENFEDKEYGEWYGYLHYDNTPSNYLKGNIFKGPFHLPRMLMILNEFDVKGNMTDFWK